MVKVVILCGGQGTRLREETEFKPKPLVEVGGLPILWHIMKHYDHHGFNEFVLCLGYKGVAIKEFFVHYEWDVYDFTMRLHDRMKEHTYHRTYPVEDWAITFANTGERTLTAGRIKAIAHYIPIDDPYFLLTYGDGVSTVDIKKLIAFHEQHGKLITVTGVHPASKYGLLRTDGGVTIADFAEKPPLQDYINGGFMVVDRRVLDMIEDDGMFESTVLPDLSRKGQVAMYPHDGFWHCMDTYKDYQDLNALWDAGAPWRTWQHHPRRK